MATLKDGPMPGACELCVQVHNTWYLDTGSFYVCPHCAAKIVEAITGEAYCPTCLQGFRSQNALRHHVKEAKHETPGTEVPVKSDPVEVLKTPAPRRRAQAYIREAIAGEAE